MASFSSNFSSGWATLILNVSESGTSSTTNQGTISWSLQIKKVSSCQSYNLGGASISVVIGGTTRYSGSSFDIRSLAVGGTQAIASGSFTVTHASTGTLSLSCSASLVSGVGLGSASVSGTFTGTTIPRQSVLSALDGELGTAQTLSITRYSTAFIHTITYKCGEASGTICEGSTSTSIAWTPDLELATQNTTGTTVSVVLTITTYNGASIIGSSAQTIICTIPDNVKPIVSFTVADAMGYLSTYGGYVQTKSKYQIAVTAEGAYGASISAYSISADGKTYTEAQVTTDAISASGTITISVTVTDSRGRTGTASVQTIVLAYASPAVNNFKVKRCDSDGVSNSSGAYLGVEFDAVITPLGGKNTAGYVVKYRKTGATAYTSKTVTTYAGQYTVVDGIAVFAADTASSYEVLLEASDAFSTTQKSGDGSSITKLFSWLSKGMGWAFGKVAEIENALEVAWDTYIRKNLYVDDDLIIGDTTGNNIRVAGDALEIRNGTTVLATIKNDQIQLGSGGLTLSYGSGVGCEFPEGIIGSKVQTVAGADLDELNSRLLTNSVRVAPTNLVGCTNLSSIAPDISYNSNKTIFSIRGPLYLNMTAQTLNLRLPIALNPAVEGGDAGVVGTITALSVGAGYVNAKIYKDYIEIYGSMQGAQSGYVMVIFAGAEIDIG